MNRFICRKQNKCTMDIFIRIYFGEDWNFTYIDITLIDVLLMYGECRCGKAIGNIG